MTRTWPTAVLKSTPVRASVRVGWRGEPVEFQNPQRLKPSGLKREGARGYNNQKKKKRAPTRDTGVETDPWCSPPLIRHHWCLGSERNKMVMGGGENEWSEMKGNSATRGPS